MCHIVIKVKIFIFTRFFQPIDIEEFQKLMKDAKLSIGTNIVKDFLDEKVEIYNMYHKFFCFMPEKWIVCLIVTCFIFSLTDVEQC